MSISHILLDSAEPLYSVKFDDCKTNTLEAKTIISDSIDVGTITGVHTLVADKLETIAFQLTTTPGNGYVLTSDSEGNAQWLPPSGAGLGDVSSSSLSTDNQIARFDGATGKVIQNSLATIDDAGNGSFVGLSLTGNLTTTGLIDGTDVALLSSDYYSTVDQKLLTTSSPTFAGLNMTGNIITSGLIDGVDLSVFYADYTSKVDQNVKSGSSPTFGSIIFTNGLGKTRTIQGTYGATTAKTYLLSDEKTNSSFVMD